MSRRSLDVATIVLFLGAIAAPGAIALLGAGGSGAVRGEQRVPAPAPTLEPTVQSVSAFPARCEAWFNDAYGLREQLLGAYNYGRVFVLGVSPTNKLLLGEDRWLFLTEPDLVSDHRGVTPLTPGRLEAWRRALASRRAWCAELLPRAFAPVGPARIDQLVAYLDAHGDEPVLDLRAAVRAEKELDRGDDHAFFPFGTHWTDRGAWAGYAAILERLSPRFPRLVPVARAEIDWKPSDEQGDSWAERLYLEGRLRQRNFQAEVRGDRRAPVREVAVLPFEVVLESDDAGLPRLVMFHDSFGESLRTWLAPHFSRSAFLWSERFDTERIEREQPDVVLQVYAERELLIHSPTLVARDGGEELRADFEHAHEVLLRVDGTTPLAELEPREETRLEADADGLAIVTRTAKDVVLLPGFEYPEDATVVMRLEISAPCEGPLTLLYKTKSEQEYLRRNHYNLHLSAGRSTVYLELLDPEIAGRLLLRAGGGAGRFVVHSLELRAVRRP